MEEAIDNHNNMNPSPDKYQICLKYKKYIQLSNTETTTTMTINLDKK